MRNCKQMARLIYIFMISTTFLSVKSQDNNSYDQLLQTYYKGTVELIKPAQLNHELETDSSIIILDTREKNEYKVSRLKNAIYAGYDNFNIKKFKNLPKDSKIVVYCSIGARSENIGEKLNSKGFNNVYNLYGGIFEWKNLGYPVYDSNGAETENVHVYSKEWGVWLEKGNKIYDK